MVMEAEGGLRVLVAWALEYVEAHNVNYTYYTQAVRVAERPTSLETWKRHR